MGLHHRNLRDDTFTGAHLLNTTSNVGAAPRAISLRTLSIIGIVALIAVAFFGIGH